MITTRRTLALLLPVTLGCLLAAASGQGRKLTTSKPANGGDWPVFGRDVSGSHHNPDENALTPASVSKLKVKWVFETGGDVSSQPAVVGGVVYFGSWDGKEYAVDAKTGAKLWEYDCKQSTRTAAAYADGVVYFADAAGLLHAVDARTGAAKWKKRIDPHPAAVGTSSPVVHEGRVYLGLSSREEVIPVTLKTYHCCTFRGGVAAFDAATGAKLWRWYALADEPKEMGQDKRGRKLFGPSGAAVWSTVSLDTATKRVIATTGNQYTGPALKHANSIVALDMTTGKEVWAYQAIPKDIWNFDCANTPDCDDLDVDFGTAPVFFKGPGGRRLVGAGQKSGWMYALDAADGKLVWKTEVGPGGKLGGIEFGLASDGERVYAAISNVEEQLMKKVEKPRPGSVSALDGATGKIIWQTPSPDGRANYGPITVTGRGNNRLVWAGSTAGFIRAYDARTGRVLWEHDTGGAIGGGPTVVNGTVYVGSGYQLLRIGKGNNKLYAFGLE
jgi:polyvinyl alcohol dehydrogenase (cytochrome)